MAKKRKLTRFRNRYSTFLSEASNEEIVSISKELTEEFSAQIKSVNSNAVALLGIAMVAMIFAISLIADLSTSVSAAVKNVIFLMRMISVSFMCLTCLISYLVLQKISSASSVSPLMWRHIRETATDENAYELIDAVRALDFAVASSKNLNVTAALTLMLSGLFMGFSYVYQMMAAAGYI